MTTWQNYITENCTEGQKQAIVARQPLIVVSAGAGAGKTHTLAQRFAYLVAEDPELRMDQILVLTFTIKAAQEMRNRIDQQLKDLYEHYKEQLPHLKERILQIDDATISTLDSFAMKITREAGLSLDIDPTFTIASAPFEEMFWAKFTRALDELSPEKMKQLTGNNEVWKKRAEELFALPLFSKIVTYYTPENLTKTTRQAISLYTNAGLETNCEWLWNFSNSEKLDEYHGMVPYTTLIEDIWDIWHKLFDVFDSVFTGAAKSDFPLLEFKAKWLETEKSEENMNAFAAQLAGKSVINNVKSDLAKNFFMEHFNATPGDYRDNLNKQLRFCQKQTEAEHEFCTQLNKISALGWHCFEQEKHAANCLSIQDLMLYAGQVVDSSHDYKTKFRYIMVDEFQDTNPLQDSLLRQLWSPDADKPNSLFIVGDLKQSIYRFRHAAPSLFCEYIDRAKNSGDKGCYISLLDNFRSAKNLLGIINNSFGTLWETDMGALKVPYEALEYPMASKALPIDNAVDLITVETHKSSKSGDETVENRNAETARLKLYTALAQHIRDYAKNSNLHWKDFTVLVPTRTPYPSIEMAFDSAQLPYALCSAKDYYGRDEIVILINLLNLLANPEDTFALSVWLASPFSGIPAEETEKMLATAKEKTTRLQQVVADNYPEILTKLEKFRNIAKLRGIPSVLMEIQQNTDFLKNYAPSQRRKVSVNLSKLIEAAEEYEAAKGNSLAGCAAYLQQAVATGQQKEEPDLIDETQDKVRVMTIHAAKGLQFTVTVLAETDSAPKFKYTKLFVSRVLGVLPNKMPEFIDSNQAPVAAFPWHEKTEKDADKEERQRCWYVGMTRAKRKLILCGMQNMTAKGITKSGFLKTFTELNEDNTAQIKQLRAEDFQIAKAEDNIQHTTANSCMPLPQTDSGMLSRITASAYALLSWCPYAYRRSFRQGLQMDWENTGNGQTAESGNTFGTVVHALIKHWDFRQETLDMLFATAPYWLSAQLQEEFTQSTVQDEARQLLTNLANSAEGIQLAKFGEAVQKEAAFRVKNGELLMVGSTDCYWRDAEGIHIRDWKTGKSSDMTNAYYKPQLDFYATALWLCENEQNPAVSDLAIDAGLVHLRTPENITLQSYSDAQLEQIAYNISQTAQLACSKEFPPAKDKCSACPWKSSCDKAHKS